MDGSIVGIIFAIVRMGTVIPNGWQVEDRLDQQESGKWKNMLQCRTSLTTRRPT